MTRAVCVLSWLVGLFGGGPRIVAAELIRGDSNASSDLNVSDAVFTLGFLFLGTEEPSCMDAADSNDDGSVELSDAVHSLNFLFNGGRFPPAPYPNCGPDTTEDALSCASFGPCPGAPPEETFPPEGVDDLSMEVTLAVEIFGIGEDTVTLEGTVVVQRSGPQGADGKTMMGEMVDANFSGDSEIFGPVVATRSPSQASRCIYIFESRGKYRGHFDIQGEFWLKQQDLIVYTKVPVRVEGAATEIPPVGQQATLVTGEIPLFDLRRPGGQPIGTLHDARGAIRGLANAAAR